MQQSSGINGASLVDPALRAMFEARKRVFVDLLGWDVPVLDGTFEIDQFDTPSAAYLVLTGENCEHRASARLLRSDGPHILRDLFPQLCTGPVPQDEAFREITRSCRTFEPADGLALANILGRRSTLGQNRREVVIPSIERLALFVLPVVALVDAGDSGARSAHMVENGFGDLEPNAKPLEVRGEGSS